MRNIKLFYILSTMMTLASCEKIVLNDGISTVEDENGTALLTISTRGVNDNETESVTEAKIYVFNESDKCVELLTPDGDNMTATAHLRAGTYTLYAIGGPDLSRFTLPSISNATASSLITLVENKVMDDLLMKTAIQTLDDGDIQDLELTLERKVISLDKIELKSIPTDVTGVEVTLSSFYSAIKLNGTYDANSSTDYTVNLTEQEDGTTWSVQPQKLMFPSIGVPTITIVLTTPSGTDSYSYTADEIISANHHITISGTHHAAQGATLTVSINAEAWGDNKTVDFTYNESNTVYRPIAGTFCNGYYVVSVNEAQRQAVLLAKEKLIEYEAPATGAAASEWRAALTAPMTALNKPINITNNWRLPTLEEVGIFSKDTQIVTFSSEGRSKLYFCEDGGVLKRAQTHHTDNSDELNWSTTGFTSTTRLRPVIDIEY
jgi:hypothetical protein